MDAYRVNASAIDVIFVERFPDKARLVWCYLGLGATVLLAPSTYLSYIAANTLLWPTLVSVAWLVLVHPVVAQLSLRIAVGRRLRLRPESLQGMVIQGFQLIEPDRWAGVVTSPARLIGVVSGPLTSQPQNPRAGLPRRMAAWSWLQPYVATWPLLCVVAWGGFAVRQLFLGAAFLYSFGRILKAAEGMKLSPYGLRVARGLFGTSQSQSKGEPTSVSSLGRSLDITQRGKPTGLRLQTAWGQEVTKKLMEIWLQKMLVARALPTTLRKRRPKMGKGQ